MGHITSGISWTRVIDGEELTSQAPNVTLQLNNSHRWTTPPRPPPPAINLPLLLPFTSSSIITPPLLPLHSVPLHPLSWLLDQSSYFLFLVLFPSFSAFPFVSNNISLHRFPAHFIVTYLYIYLFILTCSVSDLDFANCSSRYDRQRLLFLLVWVSAPFLNDWDETKGVAPW